jgi:hypothetical protein
MSCTRHSAYLQPVNAADRRRHAAGACVRYVMQGRECMARSGFYPD